MCIIKSIITWIQFRTAPRCNQALLQRRALRVKRLLLLLLLHPLLLRLHFLLLGLLLLCPRSVVAAGGPRSKQ